MTEAEAVATKRRTEVKASARPAVEVRLLENLADFVAAVDVTALVWGREGGNLLPAELLRAYAYAGDPVIGGFLPGSGEMIGICIGFLASASPDDLHLHSHMTGVAPGVQHRGVGVAMKSLQREWCLERGIADIRWTVDPMLAPNAWFNVVKLGATAHTFLPQFYGEMSDELNRGELTDRLEMNWRVGSERVEAALAGQAPNGRAIERVVAIPADYRALRQDDPKLANSLRLQVRDELSSAFEAGLEINGFSRERGYLLSPRG